MAEILNGFLQPKNGLISTPCPSSGAVEATSLPVSRVAVVKVLRAAAALATHVAKAADAAQEFPHNPYASYSISYRT